MNDLLYNKINRILADEDPLGVGYPISTDEYLGYVPEIIKNGNSIEGLKSLMFDILNRRMELALDIDSIEFNRLVNIIFLTINSK
jgi:hypothetical protein